MSLTRALFSKILPVGALMLAMAAPAGAQDAPSVEIGGGYNYLHVEETSLPGGWYAEVAGNVTPVIAFVGQITANYKTIDDLLDVGSLDTTLTTYMGGVRLNARMAGGATPFAHVLVGASRITGSSDQFGVTVSDSLTEAALQLGGGLKYMPATVGIQVGADYLRTFSDPEANSFRFGAGIVFSF